MSIIFLQ